MEYDISDGDGPFGDKALIPPDNISGDTYGVPVSNFFRDVKYFMELVPTDNVENAAEPHRVPFGLTRGPGLNGAAPVVTQEKGRFDMSLEMAMGRYFADDEIGYEALRVYLGDNLIADWDAAEIDGLYAAHAGGDPASYGKDKVYGIPFRADLDPAAISHQVKVLSFEADYSGGYSESTKERLPYYLAIPNLSFDEQNDFSLQFFRGGESVEEFSSADFEAADPSLFYIDNFALQLDGAGGNGRDTEGDKLYLQITTSGKTVTVPAFQGRINFDGEAGTIATEEGGEAASGLSLDRIESISILEEFDKQSYSEEGGIVTEANHREEYPLGLSIRKDTDFYAELIDVQIDPEDVAGHQWEQILAGKDGLFKWNISYQVGGEAFTDTSGIQYVSFFEYPAEMESVSREDFLALPPERVSTREFQLGEDYKVELAESLFRLAEQAEGSASRRGIGVYIQDFAGHCKITTRQVYYDRQAPPALDPHEGIVRWFAPEEEGENLRYEGFDRNRNVVTLKTNLEEALYGGLEGCTIEAAAAADFPVSVRPLGEEFFELSLPEDFPSDAPVSLTLTFTDYAGNSTVNRTTLYTPLYFRGVYTDYIRPGSAEWDDRGEAPLEHYFGWEQIALEENELVLYDAAENRPLTGQASFGDFVHSGLTAHEERAYLLRGKNRSGYESRFATTEEEGILTAFSFRRKLKNNAPFLSAYDESGTFLKEGTTYLGPLNRLTVRFRDFDETDDFLLSYYVNGVLYKEHELSGTLAAGGLKHEIAVQDFFSDFADGETYEIRYEIRDRWLEDEALQEGTAVASGPKSYLFDGVEPDLAELLYDKRPGFSYIYRDIHLALRDEGAGLASQELLVLDEGAYVPPADGTTLSEGDDKEGFTHQVTLIPDGRDYLLYLRLEDQVGNSRTEAIGPFSKDSQPPVLVAAELSGAERLFSRPSIPVRASWRDNLSGAAKVLYRFRGASGVLKEGEAAPSGSLTEILEGQWELFCSLSGSALTEEEYALEIKVLDNAGNGEEADWTLLAEDLQIDSTAPVVQVTGQEGWTFREGRYYLGGSETPALRYEIQDAYPSGEVWYELTREGGSVVENSSLEGLFAPLAEGEAASLRVCTRDRAGNRGTSSPFSFIKDGTAPDTGSYSLTVLDQQPSYGKGEQLRFRFDAEDGQSGIDRFFLWIGTRTEGEDRPVVSVLLPGHLENGELPVVYGEGNTYSLNLPAAPAGSYFFKVSAEDYAGNRSDSVMLSGQALVLADKEESLVVQDFGAYHNNPRRLSARWRYEGQKAFNHYAYRVIEAASERAVSEWAFTKEEFGTAEFPEGLDAGKVYYFEVYAGFDDGSRSASRFSPGSFIDLTPPQIRSFSLPAQGTPADLMLSWDVSDEESGIDRVAVRLDAYALDEEGRPLTEQQQSEEGEVAIPVRKELALISLGSEKTGRDVRILRREEAEALGLRDGQKVFVTLLVDDLAGNLREHDGGVFVKDASAPPVPVVLDGGEFVNPEKDEVRIDWSRSLRDPHSGNASYAYQILLPGEEVDRNGWISAEGGGVVLSDTAAYDNGSFLTVAVRLENGAGLSSVGYSNGITLDNTKPAAALTELRGPDGEEAAYLLGRQAELLIRSRDEQSGITRYSYEPGVFIGSDWVSLGEAQTVPASEGPLPVTIPEEVEGRQLVAYKAIAYNAAGDASLPGYSAGARFYQDVPLVSALLGESLDGGLRFTWETADTVPVQSFALTLKKSGTPVKEVELEGDAVSYLFRDLADGLYELQMNYLAQNGASGGESLTSAPVYVDSRAPELSDLESSRFVNDLFRYHFLIRDNLSGGRGYRYRIGPAGAPDLLTQGWVWVDSTGSYQEKTLSFLEEFQGGYDTLEDGGTILFSCQAQDLSGNWSEILYGAPALVDRSAPEKPLLDMSREITLGDEVYTRQDYFAMKSDRVSGLSVDGRDEQSGIVAYQWACREEGSGEELIWSAPVAYRAGEGEREIRLRDQSFLGLVLEDGKRYRLYLRTLNGSGLTSEAGESPAFLVDLKAPVFAVLTDRSGLGEEAVGEETGVIYNGAGDLLLRISEEAGEAATLVYSLIDPSSAEGEKEVRHFKGEEIGDFTIPFTPLDPALTGRYKMRIALKDAGGYESVVYQDIRLNAPPTFALQNVVANPMKPFDLSLPAWVADQDGVVNLRVRIDHKGETLEWNQGTPELLSGLALDHAAPFAGQSEIPYRVTAEDRFGLSSSATGTIRIVNTSEGTLYTDEYWTGEHQVTGSLLIPAGLSLTLAEDTTVRILADPEAAQAIGITLEEGATLDHLGAASYELFDPSLDALWKGLFIAGRADLSDLRISGAQRGVTLTNPVATEIRGSLFENNVIGLHLVGASPTIRNSRFRENRYYGVKEDGNSRPVMVDNFFSGNGFDYYDLDRTVLTAPEVNTLEGNSGNRGDN